MSTTKKNTDAKRGTSSSKSGSRISRRTVALLSLTLLACICAGACWLFWEAKTTWFTRNNRFVLRSVRVVSQRDGYWNGKERKLASRIGLEPGTNLFALDYRELRLRLQDVAGIESAQVIPVLPDTVELRLVERFPRALLQYRGYPWVVDEKGYVIPRSESMGAKWNLPIIYGPSASAVNAAYRTRKPLESILPGLDLIMAVLGSGQNISIRLVQLSDPDKLVFWIRYRDQKNFRVVFPRKNRGFAFMLSALESAIIDAGRAGDDRASFDLSYKGQVVID